MLPIDKETIEALAYINSFCQINGMSTQLLSNPITLKAFMNDLLNRQLKFGVQIYRDPRSHFRPAPQFGNAPYTPPHQEFSNAPYTPHQEFSNASYTDKRRDFSSDPYSGLDRSR